MKKLLFILIAALSFTAASAQQRNFDRKDQGYGQATAQRDGWNNNSQPQQKDYGYNRDRNYDNRQDGQFDRNKGYDKRDNRNDNYGYGRERDRRVQQAPQQQTNGLGKGLIIGGIAGVLLGVLLSK
jgi:hypothetical protein